MPELDDHQLLARFARENSQTAFAALVTRHVGLVYSVALRSAGTPHAAEEVTQAVFIILARKAAGLSAKIILSGWLYQTTRLAAANYRRTENRRQHREQEAYMQSLLDGAETDGAETWRRLAPLLDEALDQLRPRDRDAVALRFFEGKSLAEVGSAMGASEDAAKMRVNRTLEKLRTIFSKRGLTLSAAIVAGAISANSVHAAPAGLAAGLLAASKGATVAVNITTLVKGTMKTMTWIKIKFAAGLGVAALIAVTAVTEAVSQTGGDDRMTAQSLAQRSMDVYAALSSYSDTGKVMAQAAAQNTETDFTMRLQRPNLYRIDWTQTGGSYAAKGVVWSAGAGDYVVSDSAAGLASAKAEKMQSMQFALGMAGGVSHSASSTIPGIFFSKSGGGDDLLIAAKGMTKLARLADETIGGVDCDVISSVLDPAKLPGGGKLPQNTGTFGIITTTFWIGKRDRLIHQTQTSMAAVAIPIKFTDENLRAVLGRQNKPVTPESLAALRAEMDKSMAQAQGAKFVFTQTHENIVVNQKFSPADFAR